MLMKRIQSMMKVIAITLILTFTLNHLSFAAGDLKPLSFSIPKPVSLKFKIPPSVATIEDYWVPFASHQSPVTRLEKPLSLFKTPTPTLQDK